ncbi:hypothetical protein Kpol_463p19 [Vanderwaltozyma polyspora DSM 70294]|uniref:Protein kinase domain-containing protein n=1 Tax=Vanderwaltozyma polyspora (strain ATCC 22028 / DSM 70294 / BCRC 21397 / CBS 2163 / NBRC 10782 / NRRL Y-8283 / UCD 57-17) TaxID=436907 RepID=A7TQK5_VANPO|nr:uncharacterized protein Kpol_463p19 [Vanderwaltozyma polyspora DSM 70294]EDO15469.1 hypothetical protein Kpol_463p19 [Vanderwaltozyma polyspora DSM 70294]
MIDNRMSLNAKNLTSTALPPDKDNPPQSIPLYSMDRRYKLVKELGNGSFGSVSLAKANYDFLNLYNNNLKIKNTLLDPQGMSHENVINKSKRLVAIKTMITKLPTLHDYTRVREIKFILAIPSSRYLIQMFEIFIDTSDFHLHIVMECMEQNLYQMMRHRKRRVFSIPSLKSILAQVLAGIKHIHSHNFFHRDIKPENILISPSAKYFDKFFLQQGNYQDNYVVKLADFGLSRHVNNKNPYTAYVSTRWYRSPEILLRSGYYSRPLDIWAFGCVAVEVTMFKPLFPGLSEMDQIWKIIEVLGTPHRTKESKITGYKPHGGSWEIAKDLAHSLNLQFPYLEGKSFESIICCSQLKNLIEVIKYCLRWNPNERATAEELCTLSFFKGTVADPYYISTFNTSSSTNYSTTTASTAAMENFNSLPSQNFTNQQVYSTASTKFNNKTSITNTEQAMIFAGIKPTLYHSRPLVFNSKNNTNNGKNSIILNSSNKDINTENNENVDLNYGKQIMSINNFKKKAMDIIKKPGKIAKHQQREISLQEFLQETDIVEDQIEEALNDDCEEDKIIETETDSTISATQDEIELSKEIENSLSLYQIPNNNNRINTHQVHQNLTEEPDSSLRQLASDIEALEEHDTDYFSQYYEKLLIQTNEISPDKANERIKNLSNCIQEDADIDDYIALPYVNNQNYIHFNNDGNNSGACINKQDTDPSLYPVNNLLNNMSIDDSFNSSMSMKMPCVIPRGFLSPQIDNSNNSQRQDCSISVHSPQYGNLTF